MSYEENVAAMAEQLKKDFGKIVDAAAANILKDRPEVMLVGEITVVFAVNEGELMGASMRTRVTDANSANPRALMILAEAAAAKLVGSDREPGVVHTLAHEHNKAVTH